MANKTMTTEKAINAAIQQFKVMQAFKKAKGDIRTIALQEASGKPNAWTNVTIHIGYAVNGDYTESDNNPFLVNVHVSDGKLIAEQI